MIATLLYLHLFDIPLPKNKTELNINLLFIDTFVEWFDT